MAFLEERGAVFGVGEETPAHAVGEAYAVAFFAERAVGDVGELLQGVDGEDGREHRMEGGGLEDLVGEEGGEETDEVVCAGGHGAGSARVIAASLAEEFLVGVEAVGDVGGEIGAIDEAGAVHVERREEGVLHEDV